MIIKKLKHPYQDSEIHEEEIVLILGFFDGVHRGHQEVIKRGVGLAREKNLKAVLMTFNRHPGLVYKKYDPVEHSYLTTISRKEELIVRLGVDILYEVSFTSDLGSLSPQDFVDQYIINWHAQYVVAGFDYTYGKSAIANMNVLPTYSRNKFEVVVVSKKNDGNEKISSTRIRQEIANGKIEEANKLLGYYYQTGGFVIHGDARGRNLGYPTANIHSNPYDFIPKIGVYAVMIEIKGKWYGGMASIGYNITFGHRTHFSIEVNIFDFKETIYGEDVRVRWLKYLRDEIKFDSVSKLIKQLELDEVASRNIINKADKALMY